MKVVHHSEWRATEKSDVPAMSPVVHTHNTSFDHYLQVRPYPTLAILNKKCDSSDRNENETPNRLKNEQCSHDGCKRGKSNGDAIVYHHSYETDPVDRILYKERMKRWKGQMKSTKNDNLIRTYKEELQLCVPLCRKHHAEVHTKFKSSNLHTTTENLSQMVIKHAVKRRLTLDGEMLQRKVQKATREMNRLA
jgi:hypothetical protein